MLQITVQGLQKFIKVLFWIFGVLFILNAAAIAFGYVTGHHSLKGVLDLFYFDSKHNFPIYFSSFCLLFSSMLLYFIYRFHKPSNPGESKYWLILALGFLYLSIDESLALHDMLIAPMRSFFHTGRLFYFAWVIPGMFICLILVIYFHRFFWRLPRRYKILFSLSAFLFVGGAVGMEIFDGFFAPPDGGVPSLFYAILTTIEQSMEWIGELVFLYSQADYLKLTIPVVNRQNIMVQSTPAQATAVKETTDYLKI